MALPIQRTLFIDTLSGDIYRKLLENNIAQQCDYGATELLIYETKELLKDYENWNFTADEIEQFQQEIGLDVLKAIQKDEIDIIILV